MARTCSLWLFLIGWASLAPGEEWSQFRGPAANGHGAAHGVPLDWNDDQGITWKTPLQGLGWSSPVVAQGQIWLTEARDEGKSLHAMAFDAARGTLLHDVTIRADNVPKPIHAKNSHASPTVLLHDGQAYVHFGTYATACVDTATGKVLWRQKLEYEPRHGPGGSPVLWDDLLILNCDGTDVQYVVALDRHDGSVRWKTPRAHIHPDRLAGTKNFAMAFSTPTLWKHQGRMQVISAGADHVAGYDAQTGQELWWSSYDGYSIVLRPTVAHEMVFVSSCYDDPIFYAVRLGGQGDLTQSGLAWKLEKGVPHSPSPLVIGDDIYLVSDNGIASCLDAKSGKLHWQERLGGNYSASPIFVDGRIYALSEEGVTTVFAPERVYRELAKNKVSGRTLASFGMVDHDLLLRTDTELLRITAQ